MPDTLPPRDSITVQLTLSEARALAARQNPDYLAARQLPEIARGELQQARTVAFNPDLNVIARAQPEFSLTQEIEWAGQRGLRTSAARSNLTRAGFESSNIGRLVVTDVSVAYFRVIAFFERRRVVDQLNTLTDRLMAAVRVQRREGEISLLEANLAEIESGRVRARLASARRELIAAELDLKRMLGLAPNTALRLATDTATVTVEALREDTLVAAALRRRPDLLEADADVAGTRTLTSLARRGGLPNLRIGAVTDPKSDGSQIGLALGISLPVLNRNRGTIAAREAVARHAELRRKAVETLVRSEVVEAIASVRMASDELQQYQDAVLEPARSNSALLIEAHRAGKIPLTTLLLLRNQLLDAEFGYWDAWLTRHQMLVRLEAATGSITPPNSSNPATPARNIP